MDVSIFLAKAFSIYFLVIGISMALNEKQYKSIITEICNNTAVLFVTGLMALIMGILLIISHNVWVMNWPVVITVLAWLTFLKGVTRIAYPKLSLSSYNRQIKKKHWYWSSVVFSIIVGVYLGCYGFRNLWM